MTTLVEKNCLDNAAKWNSMHTEKGRVERTFGEHFHEFEGANILDAGCSVGFTTLEIGRHSRNSTVTGLEDNYICNLFGDQLIHSRNVDVRFRIGNFYKLDELFLPEDLDAIFAMNNLVPCSTSNLTFRQQEAIARNFNTCLVEGGELYLSSLRNFAILSKKGDKFLEKEIVGDFRDSDCYGHLQEIYGIECYT